MSKKSLDKIYISSLYNNKIYNLLIVEKDKCIIYINYPIEIFRNFDIFIIK